MEAFLNETQRLQQADEIVRLRYERDELIAALRAVAVDDPSDSWALNRIDEDWAKARDSAVALLKRLEGDHG